MNFGVGGNPITARDSSEGMVLSFTAQMEMLVRSRFRRQMVDARGFGDAERR
jgi:hypothetical protein